MPPAKRKKTETSKEEKPQVKAELVEEEPVKKKVVTISCLACKRKARDFEWGEYVVKKSSKEPVNDKCKRCADIWAGCFMWLPWSGFAALVSSEAMCLTLSN